MSSTVIGFEDARWLFKEINDTEVKKALNEKVYKADNVMKVAIAVDTGATRASIKKSIRKSDQGIKLNIRINKQYYLNQEYGTSRSNPKNVQKVYKATQGMDDEAVRILEGLVKNRKWEQNSILI